MSGKSKRSRRASRAKPLRAKSPPVKSPPVEPAPAETPVARPASKEAQTRENTDELFARTTDELVRFGREKRGGQNLRRQVLVVALIGGMALVVGLLVYLSRGLPR